MTSIQAAREFRNKLAEVIHHELNVNDPNKVEQYRKDMRTVMHAAFALADDYIVLTQAAEQLALRVFIADMQREQQS